MARYSIAMSIYIGHGWQTAACTLLALPWINRHPVAFPLMIGVRAGPEREVTA